jgi:hypothetical protein
VEPPPRERLARGPRNVSRARTEALPARRAGKEPVPEYNTDSDTAPGHASDSNPLLGFYSDSVYEFDFGSDPEDPESEDNSTEQPFIRTGFWAGYNIHTCREIRLLARPQARRLDRWELTLRRLPRLASLPGGNTTRSS